MRISRRMRKTTIGSEGKNENDIVKKNEKRKKVTETINDGG